MSIRKDCREERRNASQNKSQPRKSAKNPKYGRTRPYHLGRPNVRAGEGEPGWSGLCPASDHAMYQDRSVAEGDGALHLAGTVNFARGFAKPLKGPVEIDLSTGLNYRPAENFVLRPELRADWYDGNAATLPFQDGNKDYQLTIGIDAIYSF